MRKEERKVQVKQENKQDANYFALVQTIRFDNEPTNHKDGQDVFFLEVHFGYIKNRAPVYHNNVAPFQNVSICFATKI